MRKLELPKNIDVDFNNVVVFATLDKLSRASIPAGIGIFFLLSYHADVCQRCAALTY